MTNDTSPNEREYLAAIAGMSEHTISPGVTTLRDGELHTTYAVGDRICWLEKGRGTLSGVVVEVLTDDTYHVRRHVPDKGNEHFAVTAEQIVPF